MNETIAVPIVVVFFSFSFFFCGLSVEIGPLLLPQARNANHRYNPIAILSG